jgi:hypothetical protein
MTRQARAVRVEVPCQVVMQASLPSASASTQKAGASAAYRMVAPAASAAWIRADASSWGTEISMWMRLRCGRGRPSAGARSSGTGRAGRPATRPARLRRLGRCTRAALISLLLVDERTLLPPGVVDVIALERLRSARGILVLGIRSTSNPGGASHGEVRGRYVDPTQHGQVVVTDEHGLTVRLIPAKAIDNPYLDQAYFRRLDAIKDPARRAAMRDGDWGQFAGQMFTEYRWDRHTLDPITLPKEWRRFVGVDWGFAAPWAVIWAAVDEDGRVWF